MRSPLPPPLPGLGSAEAFIDDVWSKFARVEGGAGVEVGDYDLGRAEQHGIDFVEVAASGTMHRKAVNPIVMNGRL